MAAASPGPPVFSLLNNERDLAFRTRKDNFLLSLLGQAAILAVIMIYIAPPLVCPPNLVSDMPDLRKLPLVFSGMNGGGGGNHELLPASNGSLPDSSLEPQIVPPTVIVRRKCRSCPRPRQ